MKKRTIKKMLAACLAGVMVFGMTACGTKEEPSAPADTSEPAAEGEAPTFF